MNGPFAPAEGLLAYTASSIVDHIATPVDEMLDLSTDLVIGTGPFRLVRYVPNSEIRFQRWARYWSTGAYWGEVQYIYYEDTSAANNAMLRGTVDWLGQVDSTYKPQFEGHSDITVTGDGINDYINGSDYNYIPINSEWINRTWRKAICHAFNYTYLIHNIKGDTVSRTHSLVPSDFPAYNSSVVGGRYNIPYARQVMQKMGYGYTGSVPWDIGSQIGDRFFPGTDEALWTAAEFIPNIGNFTNNEWNFIHRMGSSFSELLIQRFIEDMNLIGISVVPSVWSWGFPPPLQYYERMHFGWKITAPAYFDTFNQIMLLINKESPINILKIDNAEINTLLTTIDVETNTLQRYEYYEKIQYLIHDKYYYHLPLFYDKLYHVHASFLKGVQYNSMGSQYWYPTYQKT
jgi:ABC-type transport system substrate-binding protein